MSDSEDPIDPIDDAGEDDLFGDADEDEALASPKAQTLDDDDLASDPESQGEPRRSQYEREQSPGEGRDYRVMDVKAYRHSNPRPSDGALRILRVPKFLKINPVVYDPDSFEPTEFDIANATAEQPQHIARYRKNPSTAELQSNSNVYHWSDGSITLSVGGEHYEIQRKGLAPPPDKPYNELQDGHYYAVAAELESNMFFTVGHIMEQYTVRPNKEIGDDALARLAERMAEASKEGRSENMIIHTTRDPELDKKEAEMAEKEREKARRRRENAAAKMDGGLGRAGRGGLSIGDLEGGRRAGGAGRKRGMPGAKPKRRRPEYDSDDDLPQGVGRHEEYSRDDGFVVNSDEDELESDAEEEEEEILDDDDEEEAPRRKRQRTVDADEDAEGSDVEPAETTARSRRRNVIDDDDE